MNVEDKRCLSLFAEATRPRGRRPATKSRRGRFLLRIWTKYDEAHWRASISYPTQSKYPCGYTGTITGLAQQASNAASPYALSRLLPPSLRRLQPRLQLLEGNEAAVTRVHISDGIDGKRRPTYIPHLSARLLPIASGTTVGGAPTGATVLTTLFRWAAL